MHEQGIWLGNLHHVFVHTPVGKGFFARFVFGFVAHAGPDIGGHQVRTFAGLHRIFEELCAGGASDANHRRVDLITAGGAEVYFKAKQVGRLKPSVGHVVAIAYPRDCFTLDGSAVFNVGKDVCQDLARMELIGQAIDHRHT